MKFEDQFLFRWVLIEECPGIRDQGLKIPDGQDHIKFYGSPGVALWRATPLVLPSIEMKCLEIEWPVAHSSLSDSLEFQDEIKIYSDIPPELFFCLC